MAGVTSFGKADGENVIGLGTQAWNIADGYTKIKILRLLIQLDIDEEIAKFGKKEDQDFVPYDVIADKRVESFEKFIFHLKQLIGNCHFSIEKGYDEKLIASFIERINNVEKVQDGIATRHFNDVSKEEILSINDEHFNRCFSILQSIKDELNFPINRAGLIFRQGDELNLDEIMKSIEQGE